MDLDPSVCYRAVLARDARYDGRFFTCVRTTGIYCRPICSARPPKLENCSFVPTAAAAQEAGFRPCLRCRPESSPDLDAWRGTSDTVSRALKLIESGALDGDEDVASLADRLEIGEHHLRRHLGAVPVTVAQTRRVLLAKQLIHQTGLSMIEVALASGFGSVRRFNETFQRLFHRPRSRGPNVSPPTRSQTRRLCYSRRITMRLRLERWASPISQLLLVTDDDGVLRALEFSDHEARMHRLLREHYRDYTLREGAAPASLTGALEAYFDGSIDALADVRIATGGTPFQRDVWNGLRAIPAGTTVSYGQLAAGLGRAGSSRAVGAANGANPIAIAVPCHRVIGANGTLTGYGGGLPRKQWLLDHESQFAPIA